MNDPHPSEHQLLVALKQEDSPSDADRERIRARVWAAVGTGALGAGGAALAHKAASAAPKSVFALGPAVKLGLVLAMVGSGAVFVSRQGSKGNDSRGADVAVVAALASTPVLAQSIEPLPVELQRIAEVPSQVQVAVTPVDAPLPKNSRSVNVASSAKSLDAEISLLRAAQQALQAGHYAEALGKLNEHAQRFPRGVLRHEREASRSIAQCQSGQLSAGQSRARTYLRASADSPMAARVRAACQFD